MLYFHTMSDDTDAAPRSILTRPIFGYTANSARLPGDPALVNLDKRLREVHAANIAIETLAATNAALMDMESYLENAVTTQTTPVNMFEHINYLSLQYGEQ